MPAGTEDGSRQSRVSSTPPLDAAPLRGLHVLVVDDDEDSLDLLGFVVESAGATWKGAATVRAARKAAAEERFDVMVSDVTLPDGDGYDLVRELRATTPGMLAVALTGHAGETSRARALSAGFHEHVAKPVDPVALVATIRRLVSASTATG